MGPDTCTATCAATEWDMAGECTACTKVTWAADNSVLGCSSATNSKFTANDCKDGYYKVGNTCTASADTCPACTAVSNSKTGTKLTCTSALDSQVDDCVDGYWNDETGVADVCTACTAVTNGVGLTCTSATNSQVTSCSTGNLLNGVADHCVDVCAYGLPYCALYANKDKVCTAETACTGKTDGTVDRVQVTDTTNTADRTCTPCASGYWAAGNGDCVAHSTCGCQADNKIRAAATAGTPTANAVCDACTSGSYGANLLNCAACTVVNGAASSATYTCTADDSRVSACATCDTTVKTVGKDDSTDDTCTASCATNEFANSDSVCTTCTAVADSAGTPTCTSATDSKVAACNTGFWKKTGAADSCMAVTKCDTSRPATAGANSGTCTTCTTVTGALKGATYTCTSAADSRVSACAAATSVKKVGAAGAMDTCTAKAAPASGGGGEPAGSTPAGSGVSAANTATVGFASVVLAVVAAVGL